MKNSIIIIIIIIVILKAPADSTILSLGWSDRQAIGRAFDATRQIFPRSPGAEKQQVVPWHKFHYPKLF